MQRKLILNNNKSRRILIIVLIAVVLIGTLTAQTIVQAKQPAAPVQQVSQIHPTFPMLDEDGNNVLYSGNPVSTMNTCGSCHDTDFIASHSFHSDAGLSSITSPGDTPSERGWDFSSGYFGRWNPITYQVLSTDSSENIDLTTPDWLKTLGARHVGGGPAMYSRDGQLLTDLLPSIENPETTSKDPDTGELVIWDWEKSGVVEMNCFLCHIPSPDNQSRMEALHAGEFGLANTATLGNSGLVEFVEGEYQWNPSAFDGNGELHREYVSIQGPTNENCGQCHGLVHDNVEDPLTMVGCAPDRWSTITTGQIISPQKLSVSGMNLDSKETLARPWDIHAERLIGCTDCHYSLNNPLYFKESESTRPEHLIFDPRRLDVGEYLEKPLHEFARGDSAQSTISPTLKNTMRRCDSCHSVETTHNWLPYKERHMEVMSCESCHIPQMYSSANRQNDWTVINLDGSAHSECRGVELQHDPSLSNLISGYQPVLLHRENSDNSQELIPHNLITTWFWVHGDPAVPLRIEDLKAAYFEGDSYHPGVILRFDSSGNGIIDGEELIIDNEEKEQFIKDRLTRLGLTNPRIIGEIQPYTINHNVIGSEWATKDCATCHSSESKITQPIQLASYAPGGVIPAFVKDSNVIVDGEIVQTDDGALFYEPNINAESLYVFGLNNIGWIDLGGSITFLAVLLGISVHGGLRVYAASKLPKHESKIERVYMYHVYERFWHWLQTFTIVLLLFTGLIIHKPDTFGIFSFRGVVLVHNVLAAILLLNAFLSLFYHLASGEIKQYIPRPRGFFDQMISQALFYTRGIFKNEDHPFEKTERKKLNPLQQVTYFGILNVLLPLQIITGIFMWGVQQWPEIAEALGGLPFLAPFHTIIAWLFASFIVAHVYLTTTGHTPLGGIKSMITGWDDLEVHEHPEEESEK